MYIPSPHTTGNNPNQLSFSSPETRHSVSGQRVPGIPATGGPSTHLSLLQLAMYTTMAITSTLIPLPGDGQMLGLQKFVSSVALRLGYETRVFRAEVLRVLCTGQSVAFCIVAGKSVCSIRWIASDHALNDYWECCWNEQGSGKNTPYFSR